jgi:hypothetical protein
MNGTWTWLWGGQDGQKKWGSCSPSCCHLARATSPEQSLTLTEVRTFEFHDPHEPGFCRPVQMDPKLCLHQWTRPPVGPSPAGSGSLSQYIKILMAPRICDPEEPRERIMRGVEGKVAFLGRSGRGTVRSAEDRPTGV